ncbi:MAG: GatB/YqeY domain-containing protein [Minisyncoccales bacterium]
MNLKKQIQEDLKEALKAKEKDKISVLRMINASIKNKEIDKKEELSNDEIIQIISKEIKKRKEGLKEFEKAKREETVEKEKKQLKIIEKYLPEQMSKEEIEELAEKIIKEVGAKGMSDMGKVMEKIMPKTKGKADGKVVSSIVRKKLS